MIQFCRMQDPVENYLQLANQTKTRIRKYQFQTKKMSCLTFSPIFHIQAIGGHWFLPNSEKNFGRTLVWPPDKQCSNLPTSVIRTELHHAIIGCQQKQFFYLSLLIIYVFWLLLDWLVWWSFQHCLPFSSVKQ